MKKLLVIFLLLLIITGCGVTKRATDDDESDSQKKQNPIVSDPISVTGNVESETPCTRSFSINNESFYFEDYENTNTRFVEVLYNPIEPDKAGQLNPSICLAIATGNIGKTLTVCARGITVNMVIDNNGESEKVFIKNAASYNNPSYVTMNLTSDIMSLTNTSNYITIKIDGTTIEHYLLSTFDI